MFKEPKLLEYAIEIARIFEHGGRYGAKEIFEKLQNISAPSLSYVQKVLPRLVKAGVLIAYIDGYEIAKPVDEITMNMVLNMCDTPQEGTSLNVLCGVIKDAVSLTPVTDFFTDVRTQDCQTSPETSTGG